MEPIVKIGFTCENDHGLNYTTFLTYTTKQRVKAGYCCSLCLETIKTKLGYYCCNKCAYDLCRKCFKGPSKPIEFGSMSLNEKLDALTLKMLYTQKLESGKMKVPCHQCVLIEKDPNHDGTAICNKINATERCLNGLTDFN